MALAVRPSLLGAQGVEVDGARVTLLPGAGETGQGEGIGVVDPNMGSADFRAARAAVAEARRHPLVETGGGPRNPNRVLATTRQGLKITERDLFLHLCLVPEDGPARAIVDAVEAPDPEDRAEARAAIQRALAGYVLTHAAPGSVPDADPASLELRRRIALSRLTTYHRLDTVLREAATVTDADRLKNRRERAASIMEPFRFSVRYILLSAQGTEAIRGAAADTAANLSAETRLNKLRDDIINGKITFEAAARRFSQAPSAARGGSIPPFRPGELFSLFEEKTNALEPGQISPVFPGPGGFYLVKLIRRLPAKDWERPEQAKEREEALQFLDRELERRAWRAAFDADLGLVQRRMPFVDHMLEYNQRRPRERIAQAGTFILNRSQFDDLFSRVPGTGLRPDGRMRVFLAHSVLLTAAMEQAYRLEARRNQAPAISPQDQAMAERAASRLWLDRVLMETALQSSTEADLAQFYRQNPRLFTPLTPVRVARLVAQIRDPGLVTKADAAKELTRIIGELRRGRSPVGPVPQTGLDFFIPPGVEVDREVFGGLAVESATPQEIAEALSQALGDPITTLPQILNSSPGSEIPPVVSPEPTMGQTTESQLGTPSAEEVETPLPLDEQSTASVVGGSQGGAGFIHPAKGGIAPEGDLPDFARRQPDPVRNPAKPLRAFELSKDYKSPLFGLAVIDLGWIFLEDRADVPPRVARLGVGGYTSVRMTPRGAEAWHVAEKMEAQPRPFGEVRARVEDAYIAARYRQLLSAELARAVGTTGVGQARDPRKPVNEPDPRLQQERRDLRRPVSRR